MSFPCTTCGLCCKNIKEVEQLKDFHSGDGICKYYREGVGCMIYDQRPAVCRIDEGYDLFFKDIISFDEYYARNAEVCNCFQEQKGMDSSFRVVLK